VFGWEYGVDLGAVYSLYGYEPPGFRGDIFGEIKRPTSISGALGEYPLRKIMNW
jgi:hypothetical protein